MKKNYLISSIIEETWPNDENSFPIFLDPRFLQNANVLKKKNYKKFIINDYVWHDRKKLEKDYKYFCKLYENSLIFLSKKLNEIHKTNYSQNFWRILIGPWLSMFLKKNLESWRLIENVFKKNKIDKTIFLKLNDRLYTPYCEYQFTKFLQTDIYQTFIDQEIIKNFISKKKIIFKNFNIEEQKKALNTNTIYSPKNFIETFKKLIFFLLSLFNKKKYNYFIYNTYLGFFNELKLSLMFKQLPITQINPEFNSQTKFDLQLRNKIFKSFTKKNNFEKTLSKLVIRLMPSAFLENFSDLEKYSKNFNLPKKPKVIFTSNGAYFNTKIMYQIAKLKENGSKLFYGQHGGTYATSKILWNEKHELKIADKFLSWGWKNNNKKIIKFGLLKSLDIKKNTSERKKLLIILGRRMNRACHLDSSTGTQTHSSYWNWTSSYLANLSVLVKKNIILRLPKNAESPEKEDYTGRALNKYIFVNNSNIQKAYKNSCLITHTINSTSICETMSENIPTIILFNKNIDLIRPEAKKIFKKLRENNIFFDDEKKAAKFTNLIYKNGINKWWLNNKTQKAVKMYCNYFALKKPNIIDRLFKLLK